MAAHEVCHRLVPGCPIVSYRTDIPPWPVEFTVTKSHDLSECVQRGLEEGEEAAQPAEHANCGEFHHALENGCEIQRE